MTEPTYSEASDPQAPRTSTPTASDDAPHLRLETRPALLIGAINEPLPFPHLGPVQEVCFDLGVTARHADIELTGLVFKGYAGHQLLFEQRWPARFIQQKTGEASLRIEAGTGLAVRGLLFMLHAYEQIGFIEITAIGRYHHETSTKVGDDSGRNAATVQAVLQVPVAFHAQQTELHFPLEGAWWTIQASDWSDHHKIEPYSQTYALDFVRLGMDNEFFHDRGLELEDHYSWDAPVFAAAGGKVAHVCYDMPDLKPGAAPDLRMFRDDPRRILGNAVAISHANGEFSYYAHLQQASLTVNEGQMVRRGQLLGRVGNSGQSPGPHLHFHLMEGPNLLIDRGLPARFVEFWAGGQYFRTPTMIPTRMIVHGPARTIERD
jgi:hypothetical protein